MFAKGHSPTTTFNSFDPEFFYCEDKNPSPHFYVIPQPLANCCTTCLSEQRIIILLFKRASERAIQKGRPTLNQCSLGRSLRVRKSETDSHVTAPRHPMLYYTTPLRLLPRGGGFALLDLPLPGLAWPAACSAEWFDVSAMARSGGLNK